MWLPQFNIFKDIGSFFSALKLKVNGPAPLVIETMAQLKEEVLKMQPGETKQFQLPVKYLGMEYPQGLGNFGAYMALQIKRPVCAYYKVQDNPPETCLFKVEIL